MEKQVRDKILKDIMNCMSGICGNPLILFQLSLVFVRSLSLISCANPLVVVPSLPICGLLLV